MPEDVSALQLVLAGDPALFAIVRLSLIVSLSAVLLAALLGVPLGAALALADSLGVPDTYRQSYAPAFRSGALAPSLDPSVIVPAMALVTENLGFAITGSASYETPYLFARRMTTLDHMTRGRIGWNIVTSFLRSGALAMGHNELAEHDARYDAADEFMAVMYGLWEGSWADGALKRDKTSGIYADPELITELDHSGGHHRIRAVSAAEPSLQRTPMLFQAGGSPRGRHFAATHAEGIFINGPQLELVAPQVADMRKRAAALGRDPRSLKFFAGATIIVDETEALARARYEDYKRHTSVEGMLCQLSAALGIDLSKYPLDEPIRYEKTDAAHSQLDMLTRKGSWTVRQAVESMVVSGRNLLIVGTPEQVVDEFARWVEHADVDGFNIARVLAHETMENFIDMVVPELQRRGMFKTEYAAGTLRERVTGSGPRTAPDHPASRYRG